MMMKVLIAILLVGPTSALFNLPNPLANNPPPPPAAGGGGAQSFCIDNPLPAFPDICLPALDLTSFGFPACFNDCGAPVLSKAFGCNFCAVTGGGSLLSPQCVSPTMAPLCLMCNLYKQTLTPAKDLLTAYTCPDPGPISCDTIRAGFAGCTNDCNQADYTSILEKTLPLFMTSVEDIARLPGLEQCPPLPPAANPCFPSDALVTMVDGSSRRLDALRAGDTIVAARADGTLTNDIVSHLSLADADVKGTSFVVLTTESGRNLTLTPTHHVPVGATCCANLKEAKDIVVGETVYEAVVSAAVRATQVKKIGTAIKPGLHSPVLSHGAMPIVNGVVTSFDTMEIVRLATYGLPLLEATGLTDTFRDAVLAQRKYIRSHDGYIA